MAFDDKMDVKTSDNMKSYYKIQNIFMTIFLFFLLISFLSNTVLAQEEYDGNTIIRVRPIDDQISIYEEAKFEITIVNGYEITDNINIYSPNIDAWSIKLKPDSFLLGSGEKRVVNLRAKPKDIIRQGREYGIQLKVRSDFKDEPIEVFAFVNVMSQKQLDALYTPTISIDAPDLGNIDPTMENIYTLTIENKNVRQLSDIHILMDSKSIDVDEKTNLAPLEEKSIQLKLGIDSNDGPGKENVILRILFENKTIESKSLSLSIDTVEKQSYEVDRKKAFLLRKDYAFLSNEGNVDTEARYKVRTNLWDYFLINAPAKSRLIFIEGKAYKEFFKVLGPGESFGITVTISYRSIAYGIIAIIVIILLYYLLRSPLIIKKSITSIKTKEGSLSEMKVLLHIKNRTSRNFKNIIVLDKIPKITEIGKDFEIGTIKPSKVLKHEKRGTISRWDINSLDAYEERVIAYKLHSNLNILGGVNLPVAILKYMPKSGGEKKVSSNRIRLHIKKFIDKHGEAQ